MIILKDFSIQSDTGYILKQLDCQKGNPLYDSCKADCGELELVFKELVRPRAVLAFGEAGEPAAVPHAEGMPAAYALLTLGKEVSEYYDALYQQGEYRKSLLLNAMSDDYLFQAEECLLEALRRECQSRGLGVRDRLEAFQNAPASLQRTIWERTKAETALEVRLNEGYMFDPLKTIGLAFLLEKGYPQYHLSHDCSLCHSKSCTRRSAAGVRITVMQNNASRVITCGSGETLLEAFQRQQVPLPSPCGGHGLCGKCAVRITGRMEALPAASADSSFFSKIQQNEGFRLACTARPKADCTILVPDTAKKTLSIPKTLLSSRDTDSNCGNLAIDIGTTTLALHLTNPFTKASDTYTLMNSQCAYGADVLTRIQASLEGKADLLQQAIRRDLIKGIQALLSHTKTTMEQLRSITIAGNTAMLHLLMGFSCKTLGTHPFTPVTVNTIRSNYRLLLDPAGPDIPATLLPGVSAFIGSDITAGLYSCGFDRLDKPCLFIDLGTNAEMALGQKDHLLFASAAAGPAFEGGNITWGTGSIPGAICRVSPRQASPLRLACKTIQASPLRLACKTIQDAPPIGICGTGILEITAELLKAGIMDETGLLAEGYFEKGYPLARTPEGRQIAFTQRDVRNVQLAKAAIHAGIEALLKRAGLLPGQLDTVYLAGGFGYRLDIKKALAIGLLPAAFSGSHASGAHSPDIKAVGNSSLAGAVSLSLPGKAAESLEHLIHVGEEVILANEPGFQELYMNAINF